MTQPLSNKIDGRIAPCDAQRKTAGAQTYEDMPETGDEIHSRYVTVSEEPGSRYRPASGDADSHVAKQKGDAPDRVLPAGDMVSPRVTVETGHRSGNPKHRRKGQCG